MTKKLTTAKCRHSGCEHLQPYRKDWVAGKLRVAWHCKLSGRIPGNMSKCPLEVDDGST